MNPHRILVIDDEPEMLRSYQKMLQRAGYQVHCLTGAPEALKHLEQDAAFSAIICDLKMPEMDGMAFFEALQERYPFLPVIIVTGHGSLEQGIKAVKRGVFDFIEKPFSTKKLLQSLEEAIGASTPRQPSGTTVERFDNILGCSAAMQRVFKWIQQVAFGNANVLITGESGVGKELVARSIHRNSGRRNKPFIPINCGALPNSLFESEIFGYEKGAFTGAYQTRPGLAELADGGTLFLDEICEMPPELQVKLLRMFEDRTIRRVGGKREIPVDIRVLSATNRNVEEAVASGVLREDLFFRISTIQIHIPPLRERTDDIPLLINHFLKKLNEEYQRGITSIEAPAMKRLVEYDWPGNVRELQNVIERAYYMATPPLIRVGDLPTHLSAQNGRRYLRHLENLPYKEAKQRLLEEFERDYLLHQLNKHGWNISRTARACGIDRRSLHRLIKKFRLSRTGTERER